MGTPVRHRHLIVDYKVSPDSFGSHLYSAMLNVQIALPTLNAPRTKRIEVIIDSGASRCVFHSDFARYLGIDLKKCRTEVTQGIGGDEALCIHNITLYIPGSPVTVTAGFKERLPVAGLLGMNGFFEYFRVTFESAGNFCELERHFKA